MNWWGEGGTNFQPITIFIPCFRLIYSKSRGAPLIVRQGGTSCGEHRNEWSMAPVLQEFTTSLGCTKTHSLPSLGHGHKNAIALPAMIGQSSSWRFLGVPSRYVLGSLASRQCQPASMDGCSPVTRKYSPLGTTATMAGRVPCGHRMHSSWHWCRATPRHPKAPSPLLAPWAPTTALANTSCTRDPHLWWVLSPQSHRGGRSPLLPSTHLTPNSADSECKECQHACVHIPDLLVTPWPWATN